MRQSKDSRRSSPEVGRLRHWVLLLVMVGQVLNANHNKAANATPVSRSTALGNEALYQVTGANRTEVPFDLIDNRPVFRVRLNSSDKEFRFVLDTGSHMTVISARTAARLNLRGRRGVGQATGVGGKFDIVYGVLSSCQVGEVRLNNVPVFIRDVSNQSHLLDGYIGLAFISRFITSVDYGERLLTLERPRKNYRHEFMEGTRTPIKITPSGIVTNEVRIDGIEDPLSFIMDTGATVSVLAKGSDALARISSSKRGDTLRVYGAGGVQEGIMTIFVPRLKLGLSERSDLLAAILDLRQINDAARSQQVGIVGGNFLRHFKVVFDIPRGVMMLSPLSEEAIAKGRLVADQ